MTERFDPAKAGAAFIAFFRGLGTPGMKGLQETLDEAVKAGEVKIKDIIDVYRAGVEIRRVERPPSGTGESQDQG